MAQHSIDLSIMAHHGCCSDSFQTKPTISIGTFYGGIPICLTTLQVNLLFKGPSNFPFQQTTAIKNNMSINKNFVLKCLRSVYIVRTKMLHHSQLHLSLQKQSHNICVFAKPSDTAVKQRIH